MICKVAMNIAQMIALDPPPTKFLSLDETPMHPWYESLVAEFTECFAKRLRLRNSYPQKPAKYAADGAITSEEDHDAFKTELAAHVNAVFRSFNESWALRLIGSTENLFIDTEKKHAGIAILALQEATEKASFPPKANWNTGDTLHPEYKQRLRRFRGGVVRLIEERPDIYWILTVPEQLERGISGYEEYYLRTLRQEMVSSSIGRRS